MLRRLGGDRSAEASAVDLARVRQLYADSTRGADDFRAAAGRVRGQAGLKDRFREAIEMSGMFMPDIEQILGAHDVPAIVASLPFVESMYNYRAQSRVGASGVWQILPGTARQYLQMDSAVDARSDVWLAAEGAARLLADNYRRVLSWPLALTGYNHGIAGIERAVRQVGSSSIDAIIESYQSRTFGFASRNFYAEFIAAATVFADRADLFPDVEPLPPVEFDAFTPGHFVSLLDLASLTGTAVDALVTLNPALHDDVGRGTLLVPSQYPLRVPRGRLADFERALVQLPDSRKRDRQITARYRVTRGDTLGAIARRFGSSTAALQRANNLPRADRIYINQVLEIPNGGGTWSPLAWSPDTGAIGGSQVHVVRPGDTLTRIAAQYGRSIQALIAANNLASPDRLRVGWSIAIPGGESSSEARVHVVQRGETLTQIARRHGQSVQTLVAANDLGSPDRLQIGARLSIPGLAVE